MKRRLLTVVSAILVLFVVASCGKKNGADTGNDSDKKIGSLSRVGVEKVR